MYLLPEAFDWFRAARHVIPQSLGTFHPNLTLFYVCADCNGFFGRTLEWPMRNSSTEGVLPNVPRAAECDPILKPPLDAFLIRRRAATLTARGRFSFQPLTIGSLP